MMLEPLDQRAVIFTEPDRPGVVRGEPHLGNLGTRPERAARHAGRVHDGEVARALPLYGERTRHLGG